jgi:cytochrome c nitrite reductase small subunit
LTRLYIVAIALGVAIGVGAGVGGYTFIYAKGASYLTNDPAACDNCHIMNEQYDGWAKSSHRSVAVCNDCHTPHDFLGKYMTKALNGFHHSLAFTTQRFDEPIQITPRNHAITEQACRRCHAEVVQMIDLLPNGREGALKCTGCHASVGHLHLN